MPGDVSTPPSKSQSSCAEARCLVCLAGPPLIPKSEEKTGRGGISGISAGVGAGLALLARSDVGIYALRIPAVLPRLCARAGRGLRGGATRGPPVEAADARERARCRRKARERIDIFDVDGDFFCCLVFVLFGGSRPFRCQSRGRFCVAQICVKSVYFLLLLRFAIG